MHHAMKVTLVARGPHFRHAFAQVVNIKKILNKNTLNKILHKPYTATLFFRINWAYVYTTAIRVYIIHVLTFTKIVFYDNRITIPGFGKTEKSWPAKHTQSGEKGQGARLTTFVA